MVYCLLYMNEHVDYHHQQQQQPPAADKDEQPKQPEINERKQPWPV